jgi:hypothetical protein
MISRFMLKKRRRPPMSDLRKVHFNQEGKRMLIGGASFLASTATVSNPVLASISTSARAIDPAAEAPARERSVGANATTGPATDASASSKTGSSGSAPMHAAAAAAAMNNLMDSIASGYSTTVAGTQYLAILEQSGSEYTASVANVLGATSTESSELAAQNNLDVRINELV